jgi:hypothetical protein
MKFQTVKPGHHCWRGVIFRDLDQQEVWRAWRCNQCHLQKPWETEPPATGCPGMLGADFRDDIRTGAL